MPVSARPLLGYVLFALVALACVFLHSTQFDGRPYREDEAWHLHAAVVHTPVEDLRWIAINIHPPLWQVAINLWARIAGQTEGLMRLSSALMLLVGMAATFRLAYDVSRRREAAVWSVGLLGTLPIVQFHGHELRPYALLVMFAALLPLVYLRWLRAPKARRFGLALAVVLLGVGALYTHYYALYLIAALGVFTLVWVKPRRWLAAFALLALIGVSFTAWLLPFVHASRVVYAGGITYGIDGDLVDVLDTLWKDLSQRPDAFALVLALAGVGMLWRGAAPDPLRPTWRVGYLLGMPALMLVGALLADTLVNNLTARNLMILLPALTALGATGMLALPILPRLGVVALIMLGAVAPVQYGRLQPYDAVIAAAAPYVDDTPVVISISSMTYQIPVSYYVYERLNVPDARVMHLMSSERGARLLTLPVVYAHRLTEDTPQTAAAFDAWLNDAPRLVWIDMEEGTDWSLNVLDRVAARYTLVSETTFDEGLRYRSFPFRVLVFERS